MHDDEPPEGDYGTLVTIRRHYFVLLYLTTTFDGTQTLRDREPGSYEGRLNMKQIRGVLGDYAVTRLVLNELVDRQCVEPRVGAYGNTVYLPTNRGRSYLQELSEIMKRLQITFARYGPKP